MTVVSGSTSTSRSRCVARKALRRTWTGSWPTSTQPHTVATLADRAHMSARTFARRFVEETGRTPMQWVTDQRVLYARRLLEETDLDIDRIADRSGFGTATLLRHHFRRIIGVTPSDYRRRFACGRIRSCAATA